MRLTYWIPVTLLALMQAGGGFRYGLLRQGITEGDVILLYAQKYLADHAASGQAGTAGLSDCAETRLRRPAPHNPGRDACRS